MTVDFSLDAKPFTAINGGPQFTFSEAVSLLIDCADQAEIDHYWNTLTENGDPGSCGWLKDRYGFSWQVVPDDLAGLVSDPNRERAGRAFNAMLTIGKIDIAAVRTAADG
jgi:predicted 3-demethylubiquinone-9 3-methyltransferase (glyoxalase superfamily)